MRKNATLAVCVVAIVGCNSRGFNHSTPTAGIHGEDSRVEVDAEASRVPSEFLPLIEAIGLFGDNCTVTHVGDGVAITAGHCLTRSSKPLGKHSCGDIEIRWGERKDRKAPSESKCTEVLAEHTNNDIDYAFVRVEPVPEAKIPLNLETKAEDGEKISMFGYPEDGRLFWTRECEKQPRGSSHIPGIHKFKYMCDTDGGMSGSAIIETKSLTIIGIHNGGNSAWSFGSNLLDTPIVEVLKGTWNPPSE